MSLPFPDVQVAGISDMEEAEMLISCGVKFLGFPLRLPVHKEDISEEDAKRVISQFPSGVYGILITYLDKAKDVIALSDYLGVRHIQLHGKIDIGEVYKIKEARPDTFLIKSLIVKKTLYDELLEEINLYEEIVDAFITDTHDPNTGADGATGLTHDWEISRKIVKLSKRPVILAGGLDHSNVQAAISYVKPSGVDSHTGVEDASSRKNQCKVTDFLSRAKSAFGEAEIKFATKINIAQFERSIESKKMDYGPRIGTLVLDLRRVKLIFVSALIALLAFIEWRTSKGLRTLLRLPESKSVRDFLRLWGFNEAIKECTGFQFSYFCVTEDIERYFGENINIDDFKYKSALSKVQNQLINDRFFAISTYSVHPNEASKTIKKIETERWKGPLIKEYLEINLDKAKGILPNMISSRIVYEAMTNAVRHPGATKIVAASFCENREDHERKKLYITFWDNGISMVETIGNALREGKQVREDHLPQEHVFKFDVLLHGAAEGETLTLTTDRPIDTTDENYLLFLSCLFPGVSADLERKSFISPEAIIAESIDITLPGYGLTYLLNCAVDIFDGTVTFRTGNLTAEISSAISGEAGRYSAKIEENTSEWGHFNGNLLTIELPIGKRL